MPEIYISPNPESLAGEASRFAAAALRRLLSANKTVRLLAATGASQLSFLKELVLQPDIDWPRVELFHLDEYIGLGEDHPASFAGYIRQRLIEPAGILHHHLLDGTAVPEEIVAEVSRQIRMAPVHLAFAGIGENGHLAFNDPPADFETQDAYAIVRLDERCRRQQWTEGWFPTLDDVPKMAISITVPQLLKTEQIICVAPDSRKAEAVRNALRGPVTPDVPASTLQRHASAHMFLDRHSAGLL